MVFSEFRAVIGTDGQKRDFRMEFLTDFTESVEVAGIAGVVDRSSAHIKDIAAIAPMVVGHLSGTPMFCGNKGDGRSWEAQALPPFHLVNLFKAKSVDKICNT